MFDIDIFKINWSRSEEKFGEVGRWIGEGRRFSGGPCPLPNFKIIPTPLDTRPDYFKRWLCLAEVLSSGVATDFLLGGGGGGVMTLKTTYLQNFVSPRFSATLFRRLSDYAFFINI